MILRKVYKALPFAILWYLCMVQHTAAHEGSSAPTGACLSLRSESSCPPSALPYRTAVWGSQSKDSLATPTKEYDDGEPSPEEQYMMELINRTRANPAQEGALLAQTTDPDVVEYYKAFAIDTAKLRAVFRTYKALPPLAFQPQLLAAAREHTNDMIAFNYQAHQGSDGTRGGARATKYGYAYWFALYENVYSYCRSLWHAHAGLLVDWGETNQAELGHRDNILNFKHPEHIVNEAGIGIGFIHNATSYERVGPYVMTQLLARNYDSTLCYITGVVYADRNGNNFYDIGEGIAGVRISPDSGEYYAVSGTSGGYAIPYRAEYATIQLTASGSALPTPLRRSIELKKQNIKVDIVVTTQLPPPRSEATNALSISAVTPHPVTTSALVHYSVPGATDVSFHLFDATGRVVHTYQNKHSAGGNYIAYLLPNAGKLADGLYYLRMDTEYGSCTEKLVFVER